MMARLDREFKVHPDPAALPPVRAPGVDRAGRAKGGHRVIGLLP